ncbi:ecotropic viral integration site 5 [Arctopsyche grandis]|uniref:ecotropic viral integration site 5 n=1 Tax=Arctopsyche grandis TaxID=121162 RepID=UPI00406D9603
MKNELSSDSDSPPAPNDGAVETTGSALSNEETRLLAKLEEANRMLEADSKSLNSLSGASCHSRKSSDTSQISFTSVTSSSHDRNEEAGEEDQWTLWGRLVNDWEVQWKKRNQYIRDLVRKGVPHHFRAIVWQLLCGADQSPEKKLYSEYMKSTSAYEKVIRRDIARTYPEHDFFKEKDGLGQESLFNVMKAYSLHDREVGYCQGSGFIVGLLLMQMPEEESFTVLVKIMQQHGMRDMYKPSMAMLGLCMYQLENLVQEIMPELQLHFKTQNFHTSMYASSWFLTLFTTALSLPLSCRIMDAFLSEGMDIIFKVALAMLTMGKEDLLSLDMEGMQKFFQKDLPNRAEADPDALMNMAFNTKINPKKMKKLEKEYAIVKTKEQEEQGELRRLRNENRSLRCIADHLEVESASLAETLVRWQVERAHGAETEYALAQQLADAQRRLQAALLARREHDQEECSRSNSLEGSTPKEEDIVQRDDLIQCLQQELVKVRLSEAENEALIRELKTHINELEEDKKTLRELNVDNSVAHLQEELIAVKLREAEANLSLKDLRQRFGELSDSWKKHMQENRAESNSSIQTSDVMSTPKKLFRAWENRTGDAQRREEDLMTIRIRDMETLTEMKELRLKVMELETHVQVSTNQLRRQDEEKKTLKEDIERAQQKERELLSKLKESDHKSCDLESKNKYEQMMANIRKAEDTQTIAELKQEISVLKMKNQVIITEGEIRSNLGDSEQERELQDQIAELKAKIMRLEAWKAKALGRIIHVSEEPEENESKKFQD